MTTAWLQNSLHSLLSSPGPLNMPKLPFGRHGGPGPIDIFSTKFNQLFAENVTATINDIQTVGRAALKEHIVELKNKYNPDTVSFSDLGGGDVQDNLTAMKFEWEGEGRRDLAQTAKTFVLTFSASLTSENNTNKIRDITINLDTFPGA